MKPEDCGRCTDECNEATERQCNRANRNPKPHHRHTVPGEVEDKV